MLKLGVAVTRVNGDESSRDQQKRRRKKTWKSMAGNPFAFDGSSFARPLSFPPHTMPFCGLPSSAKTRLGRQWTPSLTSSWR